MHLIEDVNN